MSGFIESPYSPNAFHVARSARRVTVLATWSKADAFVPPGRMNEMQNQLYKGMKRHHFSKEELDAIHRHYDDELAGKNRRGKEVRYWENVVEGEELPPVVKGPLDITDTCAGMLVEYNYAFAIKWAVMRQAIESYPIDPQTGEYRYRRDWHLDDALAQAAGVPYAFQIGKYSEMLLGHVVSNWMGDDGFVKVMDFQLRRINIIGDMNWLKGRVTKKYVKDGEHLVDLDIWSENQDGIVITKGTATVRLVAMSGEEITGS